MAGEIQLNSTTMATESSGTITLSNVNSATNRTNLGLGSMATQNANAVALTGGSVTGTEIDLKSSGTTIYKSDGTTAVLSESGGVVTLTADDLAVNGTSSLDGAVVVNESGADVDFRIESDTNANAFFLDGATGYVRLGTNSQGRETNLAVVGSYQEPLSVWSQVGIYSDDSQAADKGGTIGFGGQDGTNVRSYFGAIKGAKENNTSGNYAGYLSFYTRPSGDTPQERMRIDSSGNIGAPSGTNIYNASDERLKQNITDLSGCLQKVLLMRGVAFNWIDKFCDSEADKTLYGLIAQELQTVDVNLVDSFSNNTITAGEVTVENPLRVNEKFIIPMLVESIKEQQTLIESQQSQIDALTARIEALETT